MKLLVIGGTRFLGRHLVDAALAAGHAVTVFNRGRSGLPPAGVELRTGDRRASLAALDDGRWDAVVDTCGYLPAEVAAMARALAGRVGAYAFVSSVSVYAGHATPNDEDAPRGVIDDPATEVVDGRSYGPLKALCEDALCEALPAQALVLRPGLIVGPHDPTQRFTYWPARLARARDGEAVLAPGAASAPIQCIDARDLAAFVLRALADGRRGAFNLTSPPGRWTMEDLLQACADAAGVRPQWHWAPMDRLTTLGLQPWTDLPLALPDDAEHAGFHRVPVQRALDAGLALRPLAQTVADTLAWWRALPAAAQAFERAGLTPVREAEALAALATPPATASQAGPSEPAGEGADAGAGAGTDLERGGA
jgi:2'-hydroxyisoflavone reductase